jgi:hypothetical protein
MSGTTVATHLGLHCSWSGAACFFERELPVCRYYARWRAPHGLLMERRRPVFLSAAGAKKIPVTRCKSSSRGHGLFLSTAGERRGAPEPLALVARRRPPRPQQGQLRRTDRKTQNVWILMARGRPD